MKNLVKARAIARAPKQKDISIELDIKQLNSMVKRWKSEESYVHIQNEIIKEMLDSLEQQKRQKELLDEMIQECCDQFLKEIGKKPKARKAASA